MGRDAAHATDYDGDGCLDKDELNKTRPVKNCGNDPFNPLDSDHNFNGTYDLNVQTTRPDVCHDGGQPRPTIAFPLGCQGVADGTVLPGGYLQCAATIAQLTPIPTPPLPKYEPISSKVFCYVDNPLNTVNPEQAGTVCPAAGQQRCGDGFPGIVPPAFPPKAIGSGETGANCINTTDDDGDGKPNDGCPAVWADNNATSGAASNLAVLKGWLDNNNNLLVLEGCFNIDLGTGLWASPHTYVRLIADQHTGVGTVDLWPGVTTCTKPTGSPLAVYDNLPITITQQPDNYDRDGDECTDKQELGNFNTNWGTAAGGGLRDPFWPFDFFDADQNGANGLADINFIADPAHIFKTEGQVGYTRNADRTGPQTGSANPAPPASVVPLGPPDRAIGTTDLNLSARQYANAC